jgi:hypothetical protein
VGRFAPGASGTPGGRPKGLREFREELEAQDVPRKVVQVLLRGLEDEDAEIRMSAADRALAYLYGRPGTLELPPPSLVGAGDRISATEVEEAQRLLTGGE